MVRDTLKRLTEGMAIAMGTGPPSSPDLNATGANQPLPAMAA